MAEDGRQEKEYSSTDPVGAANQTITAEPVAPAPVQDVQSDSGSSSGVEGEKEEDEIEATRTMTQTTTTSSVMGESKSPEASPPKPWYKRLNPLKPSRKPPIPNERTVSREYGASFLSLLTFQWMAPLMSKGYQRPLELNDIWLVNPDRAQDVLADRFQASFERRAARGDRYPLLGALHQTFMKEFWLGGLFNISSQMLQVISPFVLRYLIQFAGEAYVAQKRGLPAPNIGRGIGLAIAITAMQMLQSLGTSHFIYRGQIVGAEARGVLITQIFEKTMRISGRARAGGKAIEAGKSVGSETAQGNAQNAKRSLVDKIVQRATKSGGGPRMTPDQAKGILGDGAGWANGRVVNLMSTDTYRVDQASGMFHMIWTSPLGILVTLVLLLINLSYAALAGFALLVIGIPLLTKVIKILFKRRKAINKITDQRVSLTQEILQSVRFVKYFGWESSFLERIGDIRKREIRSIQILLAIRNAINAVSMSLPIFASMLSFITYSLSKHPLDPAPIFSSLALFNSLRLPLNLLPLVIGQVVDAWSSLNRMQEYLLSEDSNEDIEWDMQSKNAAAIRHADFTWERTATQDPEKLIPQGHASRKSQRKPKDWLKPKARSEEAEKTEHGDSGADSASTLTAEEPFRLHDINFAVGRNELVAVIGSVGSGKSSLLAALAGDMRRTSGEIMLGASRAFCPQYAWIQNATVRENILFGKDYDRHWYDQVIDACALRPDLDMLPNGDLTEIGERGITVSGGQKQRMNIARAIYFNSDIVLMDDPLSAVDAHVGRHIFDHAICGLLKDKCRILATHQLHVLSRCDRIIWIQEGHIETIDTFSNLMQYNEGFQKMMASTAQEEKEDTESEVKEDEVEDEKTAARKHKAAKKGAALMQQEERAVKSVSWSVYAAYIKASGSIMSGPFVVLLLIISQGANITTSLWLSWWTSDKFGYTTGQYIGAYAGLGVIQALLMFAFSVSLSVLGTRSSKVLLQKAIFRVLRAPMSFFDTTPLGRITNRFSKDVDIMDNNLTDAMRMFFFTMAMIISVFILIIAYFHYFAIALGPLFIMFIFSASYYRASAREVKRHESVLRSDVFARFSEGVSGTSSIRAYGLQKQFSHQLRAAVDQMNSAYYLTFANQRWLSLRLDCIGNLLVFTTGILVVTSRFDVSPSIAGLVLSYILSIVQMIQFTIRQLAEVENAMNSTERIHYYGTELEEEAPLKLASVPDTWPEKGEIIFNEVQMRYRANLPLVLQGLTLRVAAGERIGIVGKIRSSLSVHPNIDELSRSYRGGKIQCHVSAFPISRAIRGLDQHRRC